MRRRRPPASATPHPSDSVYVEDWIDPTEPWPTVPQSVTPRDRADQQPGEPREAVPWRLLAEDSAEAAWSAWARAQPPPSSEPVKAGDVAATRAELPPEPPRQEPEPVPEKLVVYPWQGGVSLRWRDVRAFLAKIP